MKPDRNNKFQDKLLYGFYAFAGVSIIVAVLVACAFSDRTNFWMRLVPIAVSFAVNLMIFFALCITIWRRQEETEEPEEEIRSEPKITHFAANIPPAQPVVNVSGRELIAIALIGLVALIVWKIDFKSIPSAMWTVIPMLISSGSCYVFGRAQSERGKRVGPAKSDDTHSVSESRSHEDERLLD
jgi:uncharacterized membrane protein YqjE